ncbi:anthranilate phosphoribosyltransferase [Salisediminibacterium halotolerans]|uniref:anthranilate phosphoribosyltransferase n=1 Tax=Salisediminibacterium halotolerans TaxID=517425 RepID=UPI000EB3FD4F|nr:anthranilate phosphoribosyltransferase [Salisediminibacterium halotolerans]RLJ77937.1 anthranilate phosphoribosyltransferase [Actinophytocola xinjiangensis]RPE88725.1 anthranilate phosphoribosyltransferase [Salisediminibacterium halotolerans]TWG36914.1 anthranilate phosphoribosyltransferase [Salisediminibacterium halotolerans]GEL07400.1 anthranilate phosphoribosyltransferase [Salisediminibacterium halotolerans]
MSRAYEQILNGEPLTAADAEAAVTDMMEGKLDNERMAALLAIMQHRGETAEEVTGFARGMINKAATMTIPYPVLDTCGTGGDGSGTYNISTASAILLSSMGIAVAKHGNRSVSSKTGSADVLDHLGIPFQATEEETLQRLRDYHLSFFFAPVYHQAMKHVAPVRQKLQHKTIFNLLGPLTNPGGAERRIIGVYSNDAAEKMAAAALNLGIERALFVTGEDGMDEVTVQGVTNMVEVRGNRIDKFAFRPEDAGLTTMDASAAKADNAEMSARMIVDTFEGNRTDAATGLLLLNAGAALYVNGNAETIAQGVDKCRAYLGEPVMKHLKRLQSKEEVSVKQ